MDKKSSPLKLTVDNDVLARLDEIAIKIRQEIREGKLPPRGPGRSVGASTVAADILERIVREYPQLLAQFFEEPTAPSAGEEPAPVEKSHPKESRKR